MIVPIFLWLLGSALSAENQVLSSEQQAKVLELRAKLQGHSATKNAKILELQKKAQEEGAHFHMIGRRPNSLPQGLPHSEKERVAQAKEAYTHGYILESMGRNAPALTYYEIAKELSKETDAEYSKIISKVKELSKASKK